MIIPLSPMDYYFYRRELYTIRFAFAYPGQLDLNWLKTALKNTSGFLPPITSRLDILSDYVLQLRTTESEVPVEFCESSAEVRSNENADRLFPKVITAPEEALVKVRVTQTRNTAHIGFSFSHLVGDGYSFFTFLRALSDFSGGLIPKKFPSHERQKLFNSKTAPRAVSDQRLFETTGYIIPRPISPKNTTLERLTFTRSDLLALKKEASEKNPRVTTNDALMAYLLQRFYRHIPLSPDGKLIVRCPVDYRKIYSQVPDHYFGNMVRDAVACFDPDGFPRLPLATVASRVREAVSSIGEKNISASLACLNDLRLEKGLGIFENVGCPGLLVSNLSRLPFHDINVGLGKPTEIFHASLNPRLAVLLPNGDGIEVKFNKPR